MATGDLSDLIRRTRGDRSFSELAKASGDEIIRQRWQQMASKGIEEFPKPATLRAIAQGLGVSITDVVLACARSVGLEVRDPSVYAGIDISNVPEHQGDALRRLVDSMRQDQHDGAANTQARGSRASDDHIVWSLVRAADDDQQLPSAALNGPPSVGRGMRAAQDTDGEAPDAEGPWGGA